MSCTAIIVAGGKGRRLGTTRAKQYLNLAGRPLLLWTLEAFQRCPVIDHVVLVVGTGLVLPVTVLLRPFKLTKVRKICPGGEQRVDSVRAGLDQLPDGTALVAIHDAARPLVTPELIQRVVTEARLHGAALPVVPVPDTVKLLDGDTVSRTLDRRELCLAQTPQVFAVDLIRRAHQQELQHPGPITDDAQLVELLGHPVRAVFGDPDNFKVTVNDDLLRAEALLAGPPAVEEREMTAARTGMGYDVHRLVEGRPLVLGGVTVDWPRGLLGHSDADVLCHAVGDALLGAAALGDLGTHFPPTDPRYEGASSLDLLQQILARVQDAGFVPGNVDATVACQQPRLAPHVAAMRRNLARALDLDPDRVSVKATTTEGLGFAGREEGIAAHAVVMLFGLVGR